jgi:hypothetical protein
MGKSTGKRKAKKATKDLLPNKADLKGTTHGLDLEILNQVFVSFSNNDGRKRFYTYYKHIIDNVFQKGSTKMFFDKMKQDELLRYICKTPTFLEEEPIVEKERLIRSVKLSLFNVHDILLSPLVTIKFKNDRPYASSLYKFHHFEGNIAYFDVSDTLIQIEKESHVPSEILKYYTIDYSAEIRT